MLLTLETLVRNLVKNPLQAEINAIEDIFVMREYGKGHIFKKSNTISKELAFILEGSARSYLINARGNEITSSIVEKNHFFADMTSVRKNKATPFVLHFLEDSKALVASIADHRKLLETNLAYNVLIREYLANQTMMYSQLQTLFITGTAKDRYEYICETYPHFLHCFPLKFIATMIGVTPTQLSRLRSKS